MLNTFVTIIRNVPLVIKDQMPLRRLWRNFVVVRNGWGLFSINSHIVNLTGQPKVMYNTRKSAERAAISMKAKHNKHFAAYKCLRCKGYHVGKTKR